MIRVNLLNATRSSEGRIESLVRTGGGSAFIARHEVLLGFLCLGIAGAVLFLQLRGPAANSPGDAPPPGGPAVADASPIIELDEPEPSPTGAPQTVGAEDARANEFPSGEPSGDGEKITEDAQNAQQPDLDAQGKELGPNEAVQAPAGDQSAAPKRLRTPTNSPALSQLVISSQGSSLRIFAATGNQPEYNRFRLSQPNRIVIDLPGVRLALPRSQQEQISQHAQVKRVRAGLYRVDPPQTRIVLDVTSFPDIDILPQFNGLYLVVTERAE